MSPKDTDRVNPRLQRQYAWRLQLDAGELAASSGAGAIVVADAAAETEGEAADSDLDAHVAAVRRAAAGVSGAATASGEADEPLDDCDQAFAQARELADLVDRTWALEVPELQAKVASKIFAVATRSSVALAALSITHPQSVVRLLRLLARFYRRLGSDPSQQVMAICLPVSLNHPDTTELLLDVATSGDVEFARWVGFPLSALTLEAGDLSLLEHARFTPRLCEILDDERASWESRELATEWLLISCTLAGVPSLRRALRLPHLGIRFRALAVLLHSFTPPAVTHDDLHFLLEDLFVHPPPLLRRPCAVMLEHVIDYPETLARALTLVRPPRGSELLLRIVNGENTTRALHRSSCNEDWAIGALAAAYPEYALPFLDSYLRRGYCWQRYYGVLAAKRLAEPLARPRLLRAAMDGAPRVASEARKAWEELYEVPLPAEPSDDLVLELGSLITLLTAPPSPQLRSRLSVLRSESVEIRQAMLEVLLGEAPDPEALVLILFAMADETLLFQRQRKKLPADRKELCLRIYRRFGSLGVRGLCLLADQYSEPGGLGGLIDVGHLAYSRLLRKRDAEPLVELCVRRLQSGRDDAQRSALGILARIGAPPSLHDRLFALVESKQEGALDLFAGDVLAARTNDRRLERALDERMEAAWQAGDWSLVRRLTYAMPKRSRFGVELAERLLARSWQLGPLAQWNTDRPESQLCGAAEHWARILHDNQKLDDAWIDAGLADPSRREFVIATSLLGDAKQLTPRRQAALAVALSSTAQDGVAALEAAVSLLRLNVDVGADDPRLLALLGRARGEWRARLVGMMLFRQPLTKALLPYFSACMGSADEQEAESISWTFSHHHQQLEPAQLRALWADIKSPTLKALVGPLVEPPPDAKLYWQDAKRRRSQAAPELVEDLEAESITDEESELELDDY